MSKVEKQRFFPLILLSETNCSNQRRKERKTREITTSFSTRTKWIHYCYLLLIKLFAVYAKIAFNLSHTIHTISFIVDFVYLHFRFVGALFITEQNL